jgi:hypothetical protein
MGGLILEVLRQFFGVCQILITLVAHQKMGPMRFVQTPQSVERCFLIMMANKVLLPI